MNVRRSFLLLLPACGCIACSSSSSGSQAGSGATFDGGGATFDGATDAPREAAPGEDAGGSDAAAGDGGGIVRGSFSVSEDTLVQTSSSDVFTGGAFAVFSSSDACPSPIVVPMGCTISNCATQSKPEKYLSAGTVKVTGGNPTVTMTQNSQGTYSFSQQVGELEGNGMLTLSATGGDVPAFQVSIPQIAYISLTAPAQGQTVPASQDLTVSWTGGGAGRSVYLGIVGVPEKIVCRFDSAAGTGAIPSALLSHLPPDTSGNGFQIDAYAYDDVSIMVGSTPLLVQNFHDDFGADHVRFKLQ